MLTSLSLFSFLSQLSFSPPKITGFDDHATRNKVSMAVSTTSVHGIL